MKALNLVCSKNEPFRKQFEYIRLLEGNFYATDAIILIKVPFYEVIPRPLFDELTAHYGGEMYFSAENWKNAKMDKGCIFKFKPECNLIEVFDNKKSLGFLEVLPSNDFIKLNGTFPNCDNVLHKEDATKENIDAICINPEKLSLLYAAMGKKPIKLTFYGPHRAIKATFKDSEAQAVIMPIQLSEFE
jgi:hypothetical protein